MHKTRFNLRIRAFPVLQLLFPVIILVLTRCANPMSPVGGPKDTSPPKVIVCHPANHSTHFRGDEIRISFDEFISAKDFRNQVTISPPDLPNTDYVVRGKSLVVKLNDTLRANTTYSINFGDAISDITENNILKDYYYVFSTGDFVDSLSLKGKVIDAFDLSPQKNVLAVLYINNNDTLPLDSLPLHAAPYYLAHTSDNGEFILNNLKNVPLLLFSLKDQNGNLFYDIPEEKIAFSDSLVHGSYIPPALNDTIHKDSTAKSDTVSLKKDKYPFYTLHLFETRDSVQKILKSELMKEDQVRILFRYPNKQVFFEPLNFIPVPGWMKKEHSIANDTVTLWLNDLKKDTLVLKISNEIRVIDTVRIELVKDRSGKKQAKKEKAARESLAVGDNTGGSKFNQFIMPYELNASYPLTRCDFSRIRVITGKDSIRPAASFTDSLKRKVVIGYKWQEEKTYRIFIPDSVFFSYNGLSNDTIKKEFKTFAAKEFGTFLLNLSGLGSSDRIIIEILTEKDALVARRMITGPGKVKFDYLLPGRFKVKAIYDRNKNARWDSGNYRIKLQPEEILFFPKIIEVRANWDVEENWKL